MRGDVKFPMIDTTLMHFTAPENKATSVRNMGMSPAGVYKSLNLGMLTERLSYFLNDINLAEADTSFWSMTRKEIEEMDPQQRLALEVVYECFQNSGTTKWKGKNIGSYFGIFGEVCDSNLPDC